MGLIGWSSTAGLMPAVGMELAAAAAALTAGLVSSPDLLRKVVGSCGHGDTSDLAGVGSVRGWHEPFFLAGWCLERCNYTRS